MPPGNDLQIRLGPLGTRGVTLWLIFNRHIKQGVAPKICGPSIPRDRRLQVSEDRTGWNSDGENGIYNNCDPGGMQSEVGLEWRPRINVTAIRC